MSQYRVSYRYDGGCGCVVVVADDYAAATIAGMARAEPRWSPGKTVNHVLTERIMSVSTIDSIPQAGLVAATFKCGGTPDTGGDWLVVRRRTWGADSGDVLLHNHVSDRGEVVGCHATRASAHRDAASQRAEAARDMIGDYFSVVRRDAIAVTV